MFVRGHYVPVKVNPPPPTRERRGRGRVFTLTGALSVPRATSCEIRGTDNVQGQTSEHIFAPNGGYCLYYPSNLFRDARGLKIGEYPPVLALKGSLSTHVSETRTATGSELFSLLTCPHTTALTLLSIFSPLVMSRIKTWETIRS